MERKKLSDISWQVDEPTYRADPAFSYSTLARFERTGFDGLSSLYDKVESPSLLFGSCVDTLITDGWDAFNKTYQVVDIPDVEPSVKQVMDAIFKSGNFVGVELPVIPDREILKFAESLNYQQRWLPATRVKVLREKGTEYFKALLNTGDKIVLTRTMYEDVINSYNALKDSPATVWFFAEDNPFAGVERFYQLKFKATIDGIEFRCMFDELIVNHDTKTIQPIDLKTSHKKEWNFYKSYEEWHYDIQCRLYARILKEVIAKDDYFKDFKILDYLDIVVNKESLTPLVWKTSFTHTLGPIKYGSKVMRDPIDIAKELNGYLSTSKTVPNGIHDVGPNDILTFLKNESE